MVVTQQEGKGAPNGLSSLGFVFNPFERLESSNDPYLTQYLIGHDLFSVAWESAPAILFASGGGGKTAMRIYTLRECWLSSNQRRKFPISYDLPIFSHGSDLTSFETHQVAMAGAIATDLLLACAYRPELYLRLPSSRRRYLLSLLKQALPVDLVWSLTILEETADPQTLSSHLDRTYILPESSMQLDINEFFRAIQVDLENLELDKKHPDVLFDQLLKFIIQDLEFDSVFLLLDGVDGLPGLGSDPMAQYRVIAPLFERALNWAKERFYFKAFLPLELKSIIKSHNEIIYQKSLHASFNWDTPKLADILRHRVYAASRGKFGSLDALSGPALRDVETYIAKSAYPLPRETIVFAGNVLESFLTRCGDEQGYLEPEDITRAKQLYFKNTFFPSTLNSAG